ncbi:MAG TPA: ABC transporter permease [Planctomycetota bacterium]|nr:ABC transporter permease [Planctomycetota bacterium]
MGFLWGGVREAVRLLFHGDAATYHATWVSLLCTLVSITVAALLAVPYGAWLGLYRPRGWRAQVFLLRVGMSVPTVVIGLLVFGFLSRSGPLGSLDLLYTKGAMAAGLVLLAFPLLGTLAHGAAASLDARVVETARTLGAGRWRALLTSLGEARVALAAAYLAAFGRCFTELGIAITVGGNLKLRTRTLPSSIQLELGHGDFAAAVAPGILLLLLAAVAAMVTHRLAREARR